MEENGPSIWTLDYDNMHIITSYHHLRLFDNQLLICHLDKLIFASTVDVMTTTKAWTMVMVVLQCLSIPSKDKQWQKRMLFRTVPMGSAETERSVQVVPVVAYVFIIDFLWLTKFSKNIDIDRK